MRTFAKFFKYLPNVLVAAVLINGFLLFPKHAQATEIGGKRVAILMPFSSGGVTGIQAPTDLSHPSSGFGMAWDLHGGTSTAVYPRMVTSDGTISLKVTSVYESFSGPTSAGHTVELEVKVGTVVVGNLTYRHLKDVPVVINQVIDTATRLGNTAPNTAIGNCIGYACSNYWAVSTASGVHTHVDFKRSCYGAWTTNKTLQPNDALAMLSQNYTTTNNSACDATEIQTVASGTSGSSTSVGTQLTGDANGDGEADAVVVYKDTGSAFVALSTGSYFGYPGQWSYGHSINADKYFLSDVNNDLRADLVAFFASTGNWNVSLSSGSGFYAPTLWAAGHGIGTSNQFLADFNYDARADIATFDSANGDWYVSLSSGSGFWSPTLWNHGNGAGSNTQVAGDFNGDHKADVAAYYAVNGNWYVGLSTSSSFGFGQWSAGHGMTSNNQIAGDVTGEGKADIAYYYTNGTWQVGSSAGSGFWQPTYWAYNQGNNSNKQFLADVNGDGKADQVTFIKTTGIWYVDLSAGSGFYGPSSAWITGHGAEY